jgi:hypothetical protein
VLLRLPLGDCAKAPWTVSTLPGLSVTLVLLPTLVKLAEVMSSAEAVAVLELPQESPVSTLFQTWSTASSQSACRG